METRRVAAIEQAIEQLMQLLDENFEHPAWVQGPVRFLDWSERFENKYFKAANLLVLAQVETTPATRETAYFQQFQLLVMGCHAIFKLVTQLSGNKIKVAYLHFAGTEIGAVEFTDGKIQFPGLEPEVVESLLSVIEIEKVEAAFAAALSNPEETNEQLHHILEEINGFYKVVIGYLKNFTKVCSIDFRLFLTTKDWDAQKVFLTELTPWFEFQNTMFLKKDLLRQRCDKLAANGYQLGQLLDFLSDLRMRQESVMNLFTDLGTKRINTIAAIKQCVQRDFPTAANAAEDRDEYDDDLTEDLYDNEKLIRTASTLLPIANEKTISESARHTINIKFMNKIQVLRATLQGIYHALNFPVIKNESIAELSAEKSPSTYDLPCHFIEGHFKKDLADAQAKLGAPHHLKYFWQEIVIAIMTVLKFLSELSTAQVPAEFKLFLAWAKENSELEFEKAVLTESTSQMIPKANLKTFHQKRIMFRYVDLAHLWWAISDKKAGDSDHRLSVTAIVKAYVRFLHTACREIVALGSPPEENIRLYKKNSILTTILLSHALSDAFQKILILTTAFQMESKPPQEAQEFYNTLTKSFKQMHYFLIKIEQFRTQLRNEKIVSQMLVDLVENPQRYFSAAELSFLNVKAWVKMITPVLLPKAGSCLVHISELVSYHAHLVNYCEYIADFEELNQQEIANTEAAIKQILPVCKQATHSLEPSPRISRVKKEMKIADVHTQEDYNLLRVQLQKSAVDALISAKFALLVAQAKETVEISPPDSKARFTVKNMLETIDSINANEDLLNKLPDFTAANLEKLARIGSLFGEANRIETTMWLLLQSLRMNVLIDSMHGTLLAKQVGGKKAEPKATRGTTKQTSSKSASSPKAATLASPPPTPGPATSPKATSHASPPQTPRSATSPSPSTTPLPDASPTPSVSPGLDVVTATALSDAVTSELVTSPTSSITATASTSPTPSEADEKATSASTNTTKTKEPAYTILVTDVAADKKAAYALRYLQKRELLKDIKQTVLVTAKQYRSLEATTAISRKSKRFPLLDNRVQNLANNFAAIEKEFLKLSDFTEENTKSLDALLLRIDEVQLQQIQLADEIQKKFASPRAGEAKADEFQKNSKAKKMEQERLEKDSQKQEKEEKKSRSEAARPQPLAAMTPGTKPVLSIIKPRVEKVNPQAAAQQAALKALRKVHVDEACKSLVYINRILNDADETAHTINQYALLFNIFRCAQALNICQLILMKNTASFTKEEMTHWAAMPMQYLTADSLLAVREFALTLQKPLAEEFQTISEIWKSELSYQQRVKLMLTFGWLEPDNGHRYILERELIPIIGSSDIYEGLMAFSRRREIQTVPDTEHLVVLQNCLTEMRKILARIEAKEQFTLPELQALRMLMGICGELSANIDIADANLKVFLQACVSMRDNLLGREAFAREDIATVIAFIQNLGEQLTAINTPISHPKKSNAYLLQKIARHLLYISRLADDQGTVQPQIKNQALLSNLFGCYEALELYQSMNVQNLALPKTGIEILRNLIYVFVNRVDNTMHYVLSFAKQVNRKLAGELGFSRYLWNPALTTEDVLQILQTFGLLTDKDVGLEAYHPQITDNYFYRSLVQLQQPPNFTKGFKDPGSLLYTCVHVMKSISNYLSKPHPEFKDVTEYLNFCLPEAQALDMLAMVCADLNSRMEINDPTLKDFLKVCTAKLNDNLGPRVSAMDDANNAVAFLRDLNTQLALLDENVLNVLTSQPSQSTTSSPRFFRKPPAAEKNLSTTPPAAKPKEHQRNWGRKNQHS